MTTHPKENVMTVTETTTLPTLRERIEAMGFDWDTLSTDIYQESGDRPVEMIPATDKEGRIFVRCGGEALFAFYGVKESNVFPGEFRRVGRPVYLVRDDEAGITWDVKRAMGVAFHEMKDHGLTHYRHSARLRLVQSA